MEVRAYQFKCCRRANKNQQKMRANLEIRRNVDFSILAKILVLGPGSIFEIFEYTTDGTPYGKPRISSGYAMIRSPGELIYRTTSNQEDVNGEQATNTEQILSLGPFRIDGHASKYDS